MARFVSRPVGRSLSRSAASGDRNSSRTLPRSDILIHTRPFLDQINDYDLVRVSHPTDTSIIDAHTYSLPNSTPVKTAVGYSSGVDHWAYSSAGVPKAVTGTVLKRKGQGMALFVGERDLVLYSADKSLSDCKEIWGIARIHTILDADTILNENTLLR